MATISTLDLAECLQLLSLLVRGRLVRIEPDADLDPRPLIDDREAWRLIVPRAITGRRAIADPIRWPFHPAAYL